MSNSNTTSFARFRRLPGIQWTKHFMKVLVGFFAQLDNLVKALAGLAGVASLATYIGIFASDTDNTKLITNKSGPTDVIIKEVVKNGFHALMPPSSLHGPGVLTTVEDLGDGKIALRLTCDIDMDELETKWQQSQTDLTRELSASAPTPDAAASALANKILRGMSNPMLVTMSDEKLQALQMQYIKGSCQQVIVHNIKSGAKVCQVQSVVRIPTDAPSTASRGVGIESAPASTNDTWLFIGVRLRNQCITLPGTEKVHAPDASEVTQT